MNVMKNMKNIYYFNLRGDNNIYLIAKSSAPRPELDSGPFLGVQAPPRLETAIV